jgi:2-keto-4-pentenoate hydratase/2-oxohepta-3-ene-1,7-dioic acid hydratase in catechol pathway
MRIVRYEDEGIARVGVLLDGAIAPAGADSVGALIRGGDDALDAAAKYAQAANANGGSVEPGRLLAPVERPGRMFFCGVNYADHVAEVPGRAYPKEPSIFVKAVIDITGPGAPIVLPRQDLWPDYEAELAAVIGRRVSRATPEQALECVFGYTVVNDVSARAIQFDSGQLIIGKGVDTFCPMGPALVTKDEIPDPLALKVRTYVNDKLVQDGTTAEMIFSPQFIISFISQVITLEPGDVISTGTPAGVGRFRDPPTYLEPGDNVTVEVDAIGQLTNPVVAGW